MKQEVFKCDICEVNQESSEAAVAAGEGKP